MSRNGHYIRYGRSRGYTVGIDFSYDYDKAWKNSDGYRDFVAKNTEIVRELDYWEPPSFILLELGTHNVYCSHCNGVYSPYSSKKEWYGYYIHKHKICTRCYSKCLKLYNKTESKISLTEFIKYKKYGDIFV